VGSAASNNVDIVVGSAGPAFGDNAKNFLVGSNGQAFSGNIGSTAEDIAFLTAAFNVDTLTGFQHGEGAAGDRIFFETGAFEAITNVTTVTGTIQQFTGRGGLFGWIGDGSAAVALADNSFTNSSNVVADSGSFYENFVVGGTSATDPLLTAQDFNQAGSLLYDQTSGGLYLGSNGGGAGLIAILPTGLSLDGKAATDILSVGAIGDFGATGVSLF
jgi:hypothetical protein